MLERREEQRTPVTVTINLLERTFLWLQISIFPLQFSNILYNALFKGFVA